MDWATGILIVFFGGMLALLVYSILATSSAIRKKAQPSLDVFFDSVFNWALRRRSESKRDLTRNPGSKS